MCRLLYIESKEEFLIADYLKKFAATAKNSREYQGNGWGLAFLRNDSWSYYKNIKPIWEDDLTNFGNSTRIIAHARSAFKDEGIIVENNMPFYDDNYIFIFNGELRGVKIKENGRIGAEKIFNYIKRFDKGSIGKAIQKGTSVIVSKSSYVKAMNIIIADADNTYVYSHFNEDENYFTMQKKVSSDSILICSDSFIGESDWEPIKNNSFTEYKCLS